jgi:predicted dehydrogenase|nr:Gfo/Idh/MocA family oxidoreductase [uncultured Acetatifactor sp.]
MENVRYGIVGIGNMGSAHGVQLFEGRVKGARLSAVCDCMEERLKWAREHFPGVSLYEDYEALLDSGEVDAVLIATPHKLHPVIAGKAFERKLHVLTEKPAGIDTVSVAGMNRAAAKSSTVFGIMYNQRTNRLYRKLHDLVREGALGEIKRFVWIINNWYRTQAYYDSGDWRATWNGEGGGVLLNQCPHNLDIWQWILGMPVKVRAFCKEGQYHRIRVEDDATIYAEYENGASAVFITSTGEYPGTNRMEISGTLGKAVVENGCLKLFLLERDEREICFTSPEGMPHERVNCQTIEQEEAGGGHLQILENFTNAILYGEKLIAPGIEGIHGLTLSNAAYLSSWKDDWVKLPIDQEEFGRYLHKKQETEEAGQRDVCHENLSGEYSERWSVRW